ncbi:hypothetical protein [Streptomyces fradiae]|uniref:hypothetical protein n=1 Tax=Streptomyces fradiae TaxID=1906 RepID=UPI002941BF5D|nr:hypothetical protein [Streptomyces fradiae]WOI59924.1 hypothetical protein RYQ63_08425 [Streptomyces fradiae]
MKITRTAVLMGLLAVAGVFGAGAAHADESNSQAHNGPRVGLINAGQIDDPMEDVLEHVAVLGRNVIIG